MSNPDKVDFLSKSLLTQAQMLSSAATIQHAGDRNDRDRATLHILARSAELMRGAASLGKEENFTTLGVVARAVLENLISLLWAQITDSNARSLTEAGLAELTRVARINLESGKARIINRSTGRDATPEFLASNRFQDLPKRKSIASRAEEAGIADLYNIFYRILSMETHGHEVGAATEGDDDASTSMHMQGIGALGNAIGHAGVRWLLHRERTDNETLRILLGLNDALQG